MDDGCSVQSIDDIQVDLACSRRNERAIASFFAENSAVPAMRSVALPSGRRLDTAEGRGGQALLAHSPPDTRRRFETLLHFEQTMPPTGDYGVLIGPACQILETEVDRLLIEPTQHIAARQINILEKKDRK